MPEILPFKALFYDPFMVKIGDVVAPPYDIIDDTYKKELLKKSEYNIVRVILPEGDGEKKYELACLNLKSWIKRGIIKRDDRECVYIYKKIFFTDGEELERYGFLALLKLSDENLILPHEIIMEEPKKDRFLLLKACMVNLEPIFILYSDPSSDEFMRSICDNKEHFLFADDKDGVCHYIYRLYDKELIRVLRERVAKDYLFIADGHHRYKASCLLRDEMRKKAKSFSGYEPYNFIMVYLTSMEAKGLKLFATHRVLLDLSKTDRKKIEEKISLYFYKREFFSLDGLMKELKKSKKHTFGFIDGKSFFLLKLRDEKKTLSCLPSHISSALKNLDVTVLHNFLLKDLEEKVVYEKDLKRVLDMTNSGSMAFILNPPSVYDIKKVAKNSEKMPPKSTYFFPKPLSGLIMNPLY